MAKTRPFGQEISGNRKPNGELSSKTRAIIPSKLNDGQKPGKIATELIIIIITIHATAYRHAVPLSWCALRGKPLPERDKNPRSKTSAYVLTKKKKKR